MSGSIGFWFKPNYITNSRTILTISGSSNCYIELVINSSNKIAVGVKDSNGTYYTAKTFDFGFNTDWNFVSLSYLSSSVTNKTKFCFIINGQVNEFEYSVYLSIPSKTINHYIILTLKYIKLS